MFSVLLLFPFISTGYGLQIVETSYGKVRGVTDFSNAENYKHMFKGVPFTKPPIGELRFQKPQDPDPWNGVLDASKYRSACMSNSSMTSTQQNDTSEDCLYLNIFTSDRCLQTSCSVIVYFHGGSFNLDSATMFPDRFILERYVEEDIVFAIPAFRLGVFAQFNLGDPNVTTTNLLIHDCIAALKFVNSEIQSFGGNPQDVTIMGHSTGGSLVNALGFSPEIDPEQKLFQKMITLSAQGVYGFEELQIKSSIEIAKRLGCNPESQSKQTVLDCMKLLDARDIIQAQKDMEENDFLYFKSVLLQEPIVKGKGKIADLKRSPARRKLLCGVTEYEFEKFTYHNYSVTGYFSDLANPEETTMVYRNNFTHTSAELVNSDSSAVFVSAATYSQALVNSGGEVYLFETRQKPYSIHVSDMQFFIGIHREDVHTTDMDVLDSFHSKLIVNFTKYGEPSPVWEKLDPAKMNFLALEVDTKMGIVPHMEERFHEELVDFWLINMTEIDGSITKEKQQNGWGDATITTTTTRIQQITDFNPQSTTVSDSELLENSSAFYQQWWFYFIVAFAFLVLLFVCIVLKRSTNAEETPLLR